MMFDLFIIHFCDLEIEISKSQKASYFLFNKHYILNLKTLKL